MEAVSAPGRGASVLVARAVVTRNEIIMNDQQQKKTGFGGIRDGIRTGLGILGAFKDAVEETLQEAVDRGDLAPERAKQAMRDAAHRLQSAFDETRDRMDFVSRREYEELRAELAGARERLERLEKRGGATDTGGETPSGIIVTD
jgi:polyhydroxyalkanoate synthesis regulator phasin